MYTIYHNPRCRKSREALNYLTDHGLEVLVVNYFEQEFTEESLQAILKKIKKLPSEILRKNEADWKFLSNHSQFTENEILKAMIQFPKLIERPIVITDTEGVLARPIENLETFLKGR